VIEEFARQLIIEDIKHFSAKEVFRLNPPEKLWVNIFPTLKVLDKVREHYNNPISINSSYRTQEYNKMIGGAKDSMHTYFSAIDFRLAEPLIDVYNFIESLPESKDIGLGIYDTFLHIDTRVLLGRPKARWDLRRFK